MIKFNRGYMYQRPVFLIKSVKDKRTTAYCTKDYYILYNYRGLFAEITGPTQKDLIIKTDSDYELVSRAISGRSVGYFIGAVIGGPLVNKLAKYCDLMIAVCLDGGAIATIIELYCTDISLLWFLFVLAGTFEGVICIAGQKIILNLWKEKATGPLHVLHFGFGMGAFIVPQIANPFLAVLAPSGGNSTNTTIAPSVSPPLITSTLAPLAETDIYLKESRIESAYLIVGIIVASLSIVFYIYQFCCRQISEKEKESNEKKQWGERLYGKFIRSYAIDKHKFSADDGSLINTEFWICFGIGRFVGLFTGRFIPIRVLILIGVFGALVTAVLFQIFARESDLALWILTAPMGFFVAPLCPSGIEWGDFHVEFTGSAITFVLMGVGKRHGGRFETKGTNDYDNEIAVKGKEADDTKIKKQSLDDQNNPPNYADVVLIPHLKLMAILIHTREMRLCKTRFVT
ncbi:NAGLT1 [Mytilus coruscus]|uniref:NAGLT1 n=1 Tax=Mytilus coruscus TaxID=42192 RepID=A0A6J8DLD1_MYTCO|nr:NAGLT1 [Mytilus coruscus]